MGSLLLVDNSNTRTKFALADENGLLPWREVLLTREISEESLAKLLSSREVTAAAICSVVPEKRDILASALSVCGPVHVVTHNSSLPVTIDYPEPAQIGADRLANAAAVFAHTGAPAIVVDFGTAVTFDVVGAGGCYLGGAIAPGLASMTQNLARRTALLPQITLEEPASSIGKSTEEAMRVGAVIGYRGLIREILTAVAKDLGARPTVVATGGDADLISRGLPEVEEVVPDLTLQGILEIARRNL